MPTLARRVRTKRDTRAATFRTFLSEIGVNAEGHLEKEDVVVLLFNGFTGNSERGTGRFSRMPWLWSHPTMEAPTVMAVDVYRAQCYFLRGLFAQIRQDTGLSHEFSLGRVVEEIYRTFFPHLSLPCGVVIHDVIEYAELVS